MVIAYGFYSKWTSEIPEKVQFDKKSCERKFKVHRQGE